MAVERPLSTFVISLTPFTKTGGLDEAGLRAHLRRLRRSGIGVYVAGSGSGEGYTLDRDERQRVMEVAAEELAGAVPVRAMGVEPRTAAQAVELATDAAAVGLDGIQLYSLDMGHGYRPRPEELETYLTTVLDDGHCPVTLSTHQSVGYRYPPGLIAAMLDRYEHVVGVNVTSPDIAYVADVIDAVAGRADVHVGGPMHALTALALGAQGFLSSEGNLVPQRCVALIDAFAEGRLDECSRHYASLMRVFRATQAAGGIVGTKATLRELGAAGGGWPRPPRRSPETDAVQALIQVLRAEGLLDAEGLEPT